MREKLTVIVPCMNESKNIVACISSFKAIADEILIADSGSIDDTVELAQEACDCKVIRREYRTSGDFKNWAIPQASHPWVLIMDADERVTDSMANEIDRILTQGADKDGYWIYRDNHFMGHRVYHGGWNHDRVMRFFRRDLGRYSGPSDHGEVYIEGNRVGTLDSHMLHYSYWSYDQLFKKFHRYTTVQAQQWHEQGRRTNYFQLLMRPITRFFRDYILLLGILDGRIGLQLSMMAAFYTYTKQARLWELQNARTQQDTEAAYKDLIANSSEYEQICKRILKESESTLESATVDAPKATGPALSPTTNSNKTVPTLPTQTVY